MLQFTFLTAIVGRLLMATLFLSLRPPDALYKAVSIALPELAAYYAECSLMTVCCGHIPNSFKSFSNFRSYAVLHILQVHSSCSRTIPFSHKSSLQSSVIPQ